MIVALMLAGCPVFQPWPERPDPVGTTDTETGAETVHSATTHTGRLTHTGTVSPPTCLFSAGASGLDVDATPLLAPQFPTVGNVVPWTDRDTLGPGLLHFSDATTVSTRRFDAGWVVTGNHPHADDTARPPFEIHWVDTVPDVTDDGHEELLVITYFDLYLGDETLLDQARLRLDISGGATGYFALCGSQDPAGPQHALLAGTELFGPSPTGPQLLVQCDLSLEGRAMLGFDLSNPLSDTPSTPQIVQEMGAYTVGYTASGARPQQIAQYQSDTFQGVFVADRGEIDTRDSGTGVNEDQRVNLLRRVTNPPALPILDTSQVSLIIHTNVGVAEYSAEFPQVLSEDWDGDGQEDLIALLATELANEPAMSIFVFTDIEGMLAGGQEYDTSNAPVRIDAGRFGAFRAPMRWLEQPDGRGMLLVGSSGPDGRSLVVLPDRIPPQASPHVADDVALGGVTGGAGFASLISPLGDLNGDGCNDFVVQDVDPKAFEFGQGTAYVYSGR